MSVFLRNQYNLHLLSNAKQSFLKMNGNKLVVVILNNHCRICQFFNLKGKSHKYFQVRKQLCFFARAWIFWHFPGNNLTRSRIIFWVPGCCYSNIDVTVGVTASLLLFSSLHKFYWDTAFIPRTLRRYSLPRSWVKFAVAKFTVISITTVATTVLLACMIYVDGSPTDGEIIKEKFGTGMWYHSYITPERRLLGTQSKEIRNWP